MTPTQAFLNGCAAAIAADTNFLAEVAKCQILLAKNAFSEGIQTIIDDLTPADFDGSAPKDVGSATVIVWTDPVTGDIVLTSSEPLGGWLWTVTGTTNLPQTIYGYGLTDSAGTLLIASRRFATPITLTQVGDGVTIPTVEQRMNANSIF